MVVISQAAANTVLPEITITTDSSAAGNEASLTVPNTAQATANIQYTPGAVEVISDTRFKSTPAQTIKDIVGWIPGVIAQPKSNIDNRISIRGSGLTRNYGNRGINMYMDGIPINTADGLFDVFEIDPGAYRYVEVFKGANALRYGANSLGGAINFVTPTGYDASRFSGRVDTGSFGYMKGRQAQAESTVRMIISSLHRHSARMAIAITATATWYWAAPTSVIDSHRMPRHAFT